MPQQREETWEAEVGLVGNQFGAIQTGQLKCAIQGHLKISQLIDQAQIQSLLTRQDPAIGELGPIGG